MVELLCIRCGKKFYVHEHRKDSAKYCSWNCYKNTVSCTCEVCGKIFHTIPSRVKAGRGKCCSKKCMYVANSKKLSGENNWRYGLHQYGSESPRWKGGNTIQDGYQCVYSEGYQNTDRVNMYVRRSRCVMEAMLGRKLLPTEVVHHINGIKNDDRPENLKLFASNSEHLKHHQPKGYKIGDRPKLK